MMTVTERLRLINKLLLQTLDLVRVGLINSSNFSAEMSATAEFNCTKAKGHLREIERQMDADYDSEENE